MLALSATDFKIGDSTYIFDWVHATGALIRSANYMVSTPGRVAQAMNEASPLVLDLDGDGIELTSLAEGRAVFWDGDQDGILEASAWIGRDDGLLALDRNEDGRIGDHSELFGTLDQDGFEILAALDDDNNDLIDAGDSHFGQLVVWQDANGNGISDPGELRSLSDLGITSIALDATASSQTIAGNRISSISSYTRADGSTHVMADAWFGYNDTVTMHPFGPDGVRVASLLLPDIRGYGKLPSLVVASSASDAVFTLQYDLVMKTTAQLFAADFDLTGSFRTLIFTWAGVNDLDPTSRGRYIDARELAVIEMLTDVAFFQRGDPDPYVEAAATLHNAFIDITNAMMFRFFAQTELGSIFDGLTAYDIMADSLGDELSIDLAVLGDVVDGWSLSGNDLLNAWGNLFRMIDGGIGLDRLPPSTKAAIESLIDRTDASGQLDFDNIVASIFPHEGIGLNGTYGADTLIGGAGDDQLDAGSGNDLLEGRAGHDRLFGANGDDRLAGESGDDTLMGGSGNDIYVYASGLDTIRDASGIDRILLPVGMKLTDLSFDYAPGNISDLHISHAGVLILIIEDHFTTNGTVETIVAADGDTIDIGNLTAAVTGTNGPDILYGQDSTIFPHDRLYGGNGNDVLDGGAGNDMLFGGYGDDLYVVSAGSDIVADSGGRDTIRLGSEVSPESVELFRNGDDLVISAQGIRILTVSDQFASAGAIEILSFTGGPTLDLLSITYTLTGTASRDYLYGTDRGAAGDVIYGLGGDDRLYGYAGTDVLNGGPGRDYLYGGTGDDTYVISYDEGADIIHDQTGTDRITFGEGFHRAELGLRRAGSNLVISFGDDIAVTINDQFYSDDSIETLAFYDGTTVDLSTIRYPIIGTGSGDYLVGISVGGQPDDEIDGGGGDDRIFGRDGDDRLDGGAGDDNLRGEAGDDIYIASGGHDVISEDRNRGNDTLILWNNVGFTNIIVERYGNGDLIIRNLITGDSVEIDNFFRAGYHTGEIERFLLGDGRPMTGLDTQRWALNGTNGRDSLYGIGGSGIPDDTLNGLGGDDWLYGRDGNDTLDGGAGADILDGGAGNDTATYYAAGAAIAVDLAAGRGTYGDSAGDRLISIENINGSNFADSILGNADANILRGFDGDDILRGRGGADILDGGAGNDTATYYDAGAAIAVDLAAGRGTYGDSAGDRLISIENINGSNFADSILGNADANILRGFDGDDILRGRGGADILDGGAGNDTATYYDAVSAVSLDLAAGTGSAGDAAGDILMSIEAVNGSNFNDMLLGSQAAETLNGFGGDDVLRGGAGGDRLNGGEGIDTITYGDAVSAIAVDLASGTGLLGDAEGDLLISIESVKGSAFGDAISGDAGANVLRGVAGNDVLRGRGGADVLDGGSGTDTATYYDAASAIAVDLASGRGTYGDSAGDTLISIESLNGSGFDDVLSGDAAANSLRGFAGNDTLRGRGGADILDGGTGIDTVTYYDAIAGVTADLLAARGQGGEAAGDILISIENLNGSNATDSLAGNEVVNILQGFDGNDMLRGRGGADVLAGGAGADRFVYTSVSDSTVSDTDRILDFKSADGDRIDLSLIDARPDSAGDQAFVFVDTAAFDGGGGQIRQSIQSWGTLLQIDLDGDRIADMAISLAGVRVTGALDFIL